MDQDQPGAGGGSDTGPAAAGGDSQSCLWLMHVSLVNE